MKKKTGSLLWLWIALFVIITSGYLLYVKAADNNGVAKMHENCKADAQTPRELEKCDEQYKTD